MLDTNEIFILYNQDHIFVWIGELASINEKKNSLHICHNYLIDH